MKCVRFALLLLAALSMSFLPVFAPLAEAASPVDVFLGQARANRAAILTTQQIQSLQASNPALAAKLVQAARNGTVPQLSRPERRLVTAMSQDNLRKIRAGQASQPAKVTVTPKWDGTIAGLQGICVTVATPLFAFANVFAPVLAAIGCFLVIALLTPILILFGLMPAKS